MKSDNSLIASTFTAVIVLGATLSLRASAQDEAYCRQEDNPLIWVCETVTIGYSFEWGQEDYSLGLLEQNPSMPWKAVFACNGRNSGITYVWVGIRPYADDESLKLEYTQLFCQAERPRIRPFCVGPWLCSVWWPWEYLEVYYEQ